MAEPLGMEGCTQPPPLAGGISTRERQQDECLKWPILNSSQGDKVQWVLGPYFTEANNSVSSESGAAREMQGSAQPWLTHRAAVYTKQERADTLRQIVPPTHCWQNGQLFNQKLYITGNKLGGVGAWGTHPQYSQMNEQCLSGETQMPRPLNHNRSSL